MKHLRHRLLICIILTFTLMLIAGILFIRIGKKTPTLSDQIHQAEILCKWLIKKNTRRRLADYTTGHFTWDSENSPRSWTYYNGMMMDAFARMGELDFVKNFYEANILPDGKINNIFNPQNLFAVNAVDSVEPARAIFSLDTSAYKDTLLFIYRYLAQYPTSSNIGNNYLHKLRDPRWETYIFALDGLYMALPFLAQMANQPPSWKCFQDINTAETYGTIFDRMEWVASHLKDEITGLYYHGTDKNGDHNEVVWLRGAGYYAMTQADLIELLPDGERKEKLKRNLLSFLDAMLQNQDSQTGMWRNVVNTTDDLPDNRLETSGSAMIAYTLMKTYNDSITPDIKYLHAGLKAFQGIMSGKFRKKILGYSVSDIYKSSSVFSEPAMYCLNGKYVENEAKGLAPLFFATAEAKKWLTKSSAITKNKIPKEYPDTNPH